MITLTVLKDNKVLKTWKNQIGDFEGFRYILDHQSSSVSTAVKYGGYNVIGIDETSKEEVINYKKSKE